MLSSSFSVEKIFPHAESDTKSDTEPFKAHLHHPRLYSRFIYRAPATFQEKVVSDNNFFFNRLKTRLLQPLYNGP